MNVERTTASGWRMTFGRAVCLAILAASGAAEAQDANLADELKRGAQCAWDDPSDELRRNVEKSDAHPADIAAALSGIASDPKTCEAVRAAARREAEGMADDPMVIDAAAAQAARQRLEQALREADQHAANLRFEVGPPPRNLTRNNPGLP